MKTLFINYLVAMALHSKYIISILFSRIAAIVYIIVGVLILKTFYIQSSPYGRDAIMISMVDFFK